MRIETLHPLLVHFPLALLLTGTFLRVLSLFLKRDIRFTAWVVLGMGVVFAWLAVMAGELASDVVKGQLCDASVLERHSNFAYLTAFLFSGTVILDWANAYWFKKKVIDKLCPILFLGWALILIFVGYLGGSMVYEQGAAVDKCCKIRNSSTTLP